VELKANCKAAQVARKEPAYGYFYYDLFHLSTAVHREGDAGSIVESLAKVQILTINLVSVAFALSLAPALELPDKCGSTCLNTDSARLRASSSH
jgi:hypothetical protein